MNSINNLRLRPVLREEKEMRRVDQIRFDHYKGYLTTEELKYFRDEELRELFVRVFWDKPLDIITVLEDAVASYSKSKFRIEQVRAAILSQYVQDGKLII